MALTAVAGALAGSLRSNADLAARYGGEEFAVLLPRCTMADAIAVGHALLAAVRALGIEHLASDVARHVTISIGVASTLPTLTTSPERVLRVADAALYRAKAEGRDRLCGGEDEGA